MDLQRALALAYRYLGRRERTVQELREYLGSRVADGELLDAVVEELLEVGMLNDERYARLFCEDKLNLSGWGSERIGRELRARGIDREIVAATLAELCADGERERALETLQRRYPQAPADPRERQKALALLLRRGYETELALEVIGELSRSGGSV